MKARSVMSYYGSKYGLAPRYPTPRHDTIVEPFAGGAGYALHYPERKVHLYDLNEKVCGVWDYVIRATPHEILNLPLLEPTQTIHDLPDSVPQEAKWMIGWWVAYATPSPRLSVTPNCVRHMLSGVACTWTPRRREMIADTCARIKHWRVTQGSYETIPQQHATWFIDPPYQCKAGRTYTHNSVDFPALAEWCKSREGQVMVCENSDSAPWLPFEPFYRCVGASRTVEGGNKITKEVWWTNTGDHLPALPAQLDLFCPEEEDA